MKRELIYAAAVGGCVGALMTMALGLVLPLGAQSGTDGHFDEITCTDLKVMSPDGTRGVSLFARNGGGIFIYGKEEDVQHPFIPVVRIGADEDGGRVDVYDKDGKRCAYMGADEDGGLVSVNAKDGGERVQMSVNEDGGYVSVYGRGNDYSRAKMGVNEYGNGAVSTWDKNRYRLATLK